MGIDTKSLAYDPRLQLEEPGPPIQALSQQLAGTQQAPVAQAPTNKGWIDTLRGAMGNWGSTLTKGNVIPAIAQAGNIATTLSGAQNTPANAINKLAMNLAGGYGVGGNISPTKMAAPPMQTGNAAPSTQASQFKATINGDLNGDGVVDAKDIKININKSQKPMSNIEQMNTNFSPGGYSNLPGMLGQGPQSFKNDSGVSTGNPESVVNVPVSEATPDERAYALALLAGNPDVGVPGVMKYALDSETQRVNERKAEAENLAAQASLQKAITDVNKFNWERSPAYIKYKGDIKQAEAMGDKVAEYALNQQIIADAKGIPVEDPMLRRYGNTWGDLMIRFGTPKIDGVISSIVSARARIEAAAINAGATASAAKSMTDNQIALFLTAENNRLSRELNTNIVDLRNRQNSPGNIMLDDAGQKANQAEINRLQSNISKINEEINSNSLAAKGLMKGRVSIQSDIPSKGTRSTITVNGKNITGIMSPDGKTFTGDNGKVYNKK